MSRVGPLIVFGITLIVCGGYWTLWDSSRSYLSSFVIEDSYYILIYWGFRILPAVLLIVGIMCLIVAGISNRGGMEVEI